jgi:hypothetical protein
MIEAFIFAFIAFGFAPVTFLVSDPASSRNITVVYRAIVIILCILEFSGSLISVSGKNIERLRANFNPAKIAITIFIFIYSLRLLSDVANEDYRQILTKDPQEYLQMWFLISLFPAFYFQKFYSKFNLRLCLYFSHAALFIASLLFISTQESSSSLQVQGRLGSEILNPISVGHVGASLAALSIFIFVNSYVNLNNNFIKFIAIVSMMLGLDIIYLCASRGPFLSFMAVFIFSAIGYSKNADSRRNLLLILGIIILLLAIGFAMGLVSSDSAFMARVIGLDDGKGIDYTGESNEERHDYFKISVQLIFRTLQNTLLGFGLEIPFLGYPHNLILESFLATGIFGGSIFALLYLYTFIKSFYLLINQDRYDYSWLAMICVQYLISGLLSGSLYQGTLIWYFMFAIIAYSDSISTQKLLPPGRN